MKKRIFMVVGIVLLIIVAFLLFKQEPSVHTIDIYKMDTYINIKIYTNDLELANDALKQAENIYNQYHVFTDRFNAYDNIKNVYYINNNQDDVKEIALDPKLYQLLEYGKEWYYISNGIKNINLGNVIDVWKEYRDSGSGIPTDQELDNIGSTSINDIVLLGDNKIANNNPNIDLGSIAKGYATEVVGAYFKSIGINNYIINAGGNVLVGDHHSNDKYKIGITNPLDKNSIYSVVKGNNIAVVTSGNYERYYEYDGVKYGHIIDPNTLYPANKYLSVTVIANDSKLADSLSLVLFVMPLDEAREYLKTFDNVEAIWYNNDGTIVKSDGFYKYE